MTNNIKVIEKILSGSFSDARHAGQCQDKDMQCFDIKEDNKRYMLAMHSAMLSSNAVFDFPALFDDLDVIKYLTENPGKLVTVTETVVAVSG